MGERKETRISIWDRDSWDSKDNFIKKVYKQGVKDGIEAVEQKLAQQQEQTQPQREQVPEGFVSAFKFGVSRQFKHAATSWGFQAGHGLGESLTQGIDDWIHADPNEISPEQQAKIDAEEAKRQKREAKRNSRRESIENFAQGAIGALFGILAERDKERMKRTDQKRTRGKPSRENELDIIDGKFKEE